MDKPIYKNLTREDIIDALVEKDIECITDDPTSIGDSLRYGIKGYNNMSNDELIDDYKTYCEEEEE
jgi:hypothetical protein